MKIQELPEARRKVILWTVLSVLGLTLFFFWGKGIIQTLQTISFPSAPQELKESLQQTKEEFSFPSFQEITIPPEVLQEIEKEYGEATE